MLSLKENVFETLKNGKPDSFVNGWEPFPQVWDPLFFYLCPVAPGSTAINPWGITLHWEQGHRCNAYHKRKPKFVLMLHNGRNTARHPISKTSSLTGLRQRKRQRR